MKQQGHLAQKGKNSQETDFARADELIKKAKDDGSIRVVKCEVPFAENIVLSDISIHAFGTEEDKIYAFSEWYRSNVRRGNTVVQVFDNSPKEERVFFGRRGFEKFFDLMYQYMQYSQGEIKGFEEISIKNADEHSGLYGVIFDRAKKAIEHNKKVIVYKLVKANGENAQVSYVKKLQAWLIASKNVSLLARTEKDLNLYAADRFGFAKLIAKEWFRHVQRIENLGSLDELKEYMNGKTFVGEYCGNQEYQHLVKYTEVDIHFVAAVDNNSDVTCLPPDEAFGVFTKYGLTCVKYQNMGAYTAWDELNQGLKKIYEEVAKAPIDSEEEGAVLYMVEDDQAGNQEVLSLSKLKTLEYRIYRKLREKLKHFLHQKGGTYRPWREIYKKFTDETEELCQHTKPPMPLGYYFAVAREAFEFGESFKAQSGLVHDQYITFLSLLMHSMSQGKKLSPDDFTEGNINRIIPIPWADYTKNYKEKEVKEKPEEEKTQEKSESKNPPAKKVYVIVPIGIPGMGKSFSINVFRKIVESHKCDLSVVSSDGVRKECMDKLAKSNKKLTTSELFEKSGKDARDLYNQRVSDLIFTSDKRKCPAHFIFLDKNHPPNALKGTFDLIKKNGPHLDLEIIALTPLMENGVFAYEDQGKKHHYPFSSNFFFHCLSRVQARTEHETLPGSGVDSSRVLLMFFHMFRGVGLSTESVIKNGFNKHMQVPFTAEGNPVEIPAELKEIFIKILKETKPGDTCKNENLVEKFTEALEKASLQFQNPDPAYVEEHTKKFFAEDILPGISTNTTKATESTRNPIIEERKVETENRDEKKEARKKVYVVVPIGIPGMGKSFSIELFRKMVESHKCTLSVVSSDGVRRECMDKLANTNKKLTTDQLFEKSGREARDVYNERVSDLIFTSDKKKCPAHFVFLDKNHPPNALKGTFELIQKNSPHLDLEIIALTSLMDKEVFGYDEKDKKHSYPFSSNFFFHCLSRVQARKEHETLPGSGVNTSRVLLMFFHMFRDVKLDTQGIAKYGFQQHLQVPFTNETNPIHIPTHLMDLFVKILKETKPGDTCKKENLLEKFTEELEKANLQFQNPEPAYVEECLSRFFAEKILPSIGTESSKSNGERTRGGVEKSNGPKSKAEKGASLPLYLGLFVLETEVVKRFILKGLEQLVKIYEDDTIIRDFTEQYRANSLSKMKFIRDPHVTSLYIGNNRSRLENEYYKTFKQGHQMELEILGFVIVPGKIATAICYPDQSVIKIENKFPHMTLMTGEWPAKESNDVFESLFGENGSLKEKYQNKEFASLEEYNYKGPVKTQSGEGIAYVVLVAPHLRVPVEAQESNSTV